MSMYRGANPFDSLTPAVKSLIVANVVMFFAVWISPGPLLHFLGLTPVLVLKNFWIWQVVTYAFLHASGWHLFFNMFSLWMFGPSIESLWGTRLFVKYYALCTVGATVLQFFVAPHQLVIGASGAVYGLLLAFGFLFPDVIIQLFFVFPLRALQAVAFIAVLTLFSAMSSGGSGIAHFAHLGGMATGLLFFKFPEWKNKFHFWKIERAFKNPLGGRLRQTRNSTPDDLKDEVDRILEKISSKGVDSLTPEEHQTMQRYAKKKG